MKHYLLTALLLALSGLTSAEALTDANIQRWADAYRSVVQWADGQEAPEGTWNMSEGANPFSQSLAAIQGREAYDEYAAILDEHDFTPESWAHTGDRIFRAMMALEMGEQQPQMDRQMQQALAEIENNPNMSPQQKAQMKAMIESGMSGMAQMQAAADNAPPGDVDAVRRNRAQLQTLLKTP